jgi:signal transduction histidine kinase
MVTLRNDAAIMLEALVADMAMDQTLSEQKFKSEGGKEGESSGLNTAAMGHALARVNDGFDIKRMVAEFRALRASVCRLWWESNPQPHAEAVEDMDRFHEAVDQLIAGSISAFAERIDRSRRLFMGILGHDLRQPLHSIQMFADVLLRPNPPDDYRTVVSSISQCCSGMASMLRDLLDFTSSQLGSAMPILRAPCDFGKIVGDVLEEVRASAPDARLILEREGDCAGEWDDVRLRQLVSNLLTNAVQHGASSGVVTIGLRGSAEMVTLSVNNSGNPIPKNALGTLFDPMVRIHDPEKFRPHGSVGLGLYICRQVVIAHGGQIKVDSSAESGTTFTVTLPQLAAVTLDDPV